MDITTLRPLPYLFKPGVFLGAFICHNSKQNQHTIKSRPNIT